MGGSEMLNEPPIKTGMRGKDLQKLLMVAREFGVVILVRHTNDSSLKYIGQPGFYPKPAAVKAKTADVNPPPTSRSVNGRLTFTSYQVAGLVVHPGFHPACYKASKLPKALDAWVHTLETLAPTLMHHTVDPNNPSTWAIWGVDRKAVHAPRWSWRVDVDPASPQFGCLQLKGGTMPWSYIHGDYDLKDVIVVGKEQDNRRNEGTLDGVKNFTPLLDDLEFENVRQRLNEKMGADMVQHGAEAQFAWHGDEPITVAFPDARHLILIDAMTVQAWYRDLNRSVLAKKGHDYLQDRSRMFHFGPNGIFGPGKLPADTWG
jgi:hypothetical protein